MTCSQNVLSLLTSLKSHHTAFRTHRPYLPLSAVYLYHHFFMLVRSFLPTAVLCGLRAVQAVTVYGIQGQIQQTYGADAATTSSGALPEYTAPAFNDVILQPPPVPSPPISTQFGLTLQTSASNVQGLSIPQSGAFYGFSIEFSVVNQVGKY